MKMWNVYRGSVLYQNKFRSIRGLNFELWPQNQKGFPLGNKEFYYQSSMQKTQCVIHRKNVGIYYFDLWTSKSIGVLIRLKGVLI